jgi:hypothetical protein
MFSALNTLETQGIDWSNLSALGTLMALVLWFATKGLPSIMTKWETQAEAARADFKSVVDSMIDESREQRRDFRIELQQHRDRSERLAMSGHEALNGLTGEITELKHSLQSQMDRTHGETKSH